MAKFLFIIFTCCISFSLNGQSIRISVFNSESINTLVFSVVEGKYLVKRGKTIIDTLFTNDILYITKVQDSINLKGMGPFGGSYENVYFEGIDKSNVFQLKPVFPNLSSRSYDDNLDLSIAFNRLQLTNEVKLDKYIAGVVEAEGGGYAHKQFYKAQSLLCRTYAVKNIVRHGGENFNLCDEVHCQAFKGRVKHNPIIIEATNETTDTVLIDVDSNLITAAFHANSGGETCNADHVWLNSMPYLEGKKDPWSIGGRGANWQKEISVEEWIEFLIDHGMKLSGKEKASDFIYNQSSRQKYYTFNGESITFSRIRSDLKLRSAYFSIKKKNNSTLIFEGKGYGHGIGMSQEGAMKMANEGYGYMDIINFYFKNVDPINIHDL